MGSHLVTARRLSQPSARALPLLAAAAITFAALAPVRAQQDGPVQRMVELNRQALNAYAAGDYEAAKTSLLDAVVQGKAAGLADDRMMARTYVHLAAVYVEGLKDRPKGVRYFVNALRIRPEIRITPSLVTPTLTEAFEEARREVQSGAPVTPLVPTPAPPAPAEPAVPPVSAGPSTPIVPAAPPRGGGGGDEPDLPATLSQPLQCPVPDEAPPAHPIFLRCVGGSEVPAARVLLFYRLPGAEKFSSTKMSRSPRGWWTGSIPAEAATGKSVQYYFEARDASGQEVASNGRIDSPNLMLIRDGAAVVGKGTLTGVHISSGGGPSIEENPLEEFQRREPIRAPGVHRRKVKAFWFGLGLGSAYGWHRATQLEFRTDLRVESGLSGAGLFYLAPELGFQVNEWFGISIQGRHQFIPEQKEGTPDRKPGGPASGAQSVLGKLSYFAGSGNFQVVISAMGGGGEGFRLVVPPKPTTDPGTSLPRNDTVRAGPYMAGGGLTFLYHFTTHVALALDLKALVGFPDQGRVLDFGLGTQFGF